MNKKNKCDKKDKYCAETSRGPVIVNYRLVEAQKISDQDLEKIKFCHALKSELFDKMDATDDPSQLKILAKEVQDNEFKLQELWGFEKNINYHRFWLVPKCQCASADNEEAYPTGHYSREESCPVHGNSL